MSSASLIIRSCSRLARLSSLQTTTRMSPRCLVSLVGGRQGQLTCPTTRGMATKGDQELSKFLQEEIATEKKNSRAGPKLEGWNISSEGSEVTLTKELVGEKVMITLNVNHTVDSAEPDDGTEEAPEMLSRPTFEVDIIKSNGKTLSFTCSYTQQEEQQQAQNEEEIDDTFAIDEVTMFDGDNHSDANYAVAGDILDGYLYDLFMNMLEERGVDSNFAEALSEWCSAHEHSQYINLLQELDKFAKI